MNQINTLAQRVKLLTEQGEPDIAVKELLDFVAQLSDDSFQELKINLFQTNFRFTLIEREKHQGTISFENFKTAKNEIAMISWGLIENVLTKLKDINESEFLRSGERNIVGTWFCKEISPSTGNYNRILWVIKEHTHKATYLDEKTNILRKDTPEKKYNLKGNLFTTFQPNGKITKGSMEWVDDDTFIYTIIEGTKEILMGHQRTYSKTY